MKADGDSQDPQPGRQTHVIASPNPTVKESDAPAEAPPPPVTSTKVEGKATTKQAPLNKSNKRKRPAKPPND